MRKLDFRSAQHTLSIDNELDLYWLAADFAALNPCAIH